MLAPLYCSIMCGPYMCGMAANGLTAMRMDAV